MERPRPSAAINVADRSEVVTGPVVGAMLADRGGQSVYFTQSNAGNRNRAAHICE